MFSESVAKEGHFHLDSRVTAADFLCFKSATSIERKFGRLGPGVNDKCSPET
jgi:hypothetical protein